MPGAAVTVGENCGSAAEAADQCVQLSGNFFHLARRLGCGLHRGRRFFDHLRNLFDALGNARAGFALLLG